MAILRKQSVIVTVRPPYGKPTLAQKIVRSVLPPIARALRPVFSFTYDILFGWLDKRTAVRLEQQFAQDIQTALPFLFSVHAGKVVPNQGVSFPLGFDYAYVTVSNAPLLIRFLRGRGEFTVEAGSTFAPENFVECSLLVRVLTSMDAEPPAALEEADRLLRPHVEGLKAAMSPERYEQMLNATIELGNSLAQKQLHELRAKGADAEIWTHG